MKHRCCATLAGQSWVYGDSCSLPVRFYRDVIVMEFRQQKPRREFYCARHGNMLTRKAVKFGWDAKLQPADETTDVLHPALRAKRAAERSEP